MITFSKIQILVFIILSALGISAITYFAEHNHSILLFGVYPACLAAGLGFLAWIEN